MVGFFTHVSYFLDLMTAHELQPSLLSLDSLKYVPCRVKVELENTSLVLSMNSQKR